MKEYLLIVMGSVMLSALITGMLPGGKMSTIVNSIAKTICVLAIIGPIPAFIQKGGFDEKSHFSQLFFNSTVIQTDDEFINYYSERQIAAVEKTLEDELQAKYNLETNVVIKWNEANEADRKRGYLIRVLQIKIECDNALQSQKTEIIDYIKNTYGCEVYIA